MTLLAGRARWARWAAGLVAASALPVALTAAPMAAAATTSSAATLYGQAMASTKSWTVHYTSTGLNSKVSIVESGDAGPASGTQQVLIGTGPAAENASLVVIGEITYFKGNASALEALMNLSPTQAATDAEKWVYFSSSNPKFAQVVAGVRSNDVARQLALQGPYTFGTPRKLDGHEVVAIRGTQRVQGLKTEPAVLYVLSSGRHLPVEEDTVTAQGQPNGMDHVVFTKWGEHVRPTAPAGALTIGPFRAI